MTIARAHLVDPSVTRWYHCVTRCVRRAFLLGEGTHDRKSWIEHRLEELAQIFSVAVAGFAVLDNHLHLLVRLDPDVAQGWSDEDVVRRWGRLFPPRDKSRQAAPVSDEWVQARLKDARWVATARERLQSLSWFMKCLKEPLSRLANREEQTRGAFFEGRFKSVAILDEESLLATCAYIDLNPVAAGIAEVPEASAAYLDQATGRACQGTGTNRGPEGRPSRQRRGLDCGGGPGRGAVALSDRGSTAAGFVTRRDARRILAGQLPAPGGVHRAVVPRGQSRDLRVSWPGSSSGWGATPRTGRRGCRSWPRGRLLGRFFAASRARLREVAERLGVHHLANLGGCAVR